MTMSWWSLLTYRKGILKTSNRGPTINVNGDHCRDVAVAELRTR